LWDGSESTNVTANKPFASWPSRDLLFIKLWALKNAKNEKSVSKISKWSNLRGPALKKEILRF